MGLELPGWLTEPLGWIGLTWPEADEELLFEAGSEWITFATALSSIANNADTAAKDVWTSTTVDDDAVNAFQEWWTRDEGPQMRLPEDMAGSEIIGAALIVFAAITLAMKIAFIVQLIILIVEVAQAIATAFATFGATAAEVPGFIAATRVVCRQLIKQVVEHIQTVIKELFEKAKNLFKKVGDKLGGKGSRKFEEKLAEDLGKTNPHFDPTKSAYSENCTGVVQAYELRRRGINVEAGPLEKHLWSSEGGPGGRDLSVISNTWGRKFSDASHAPPWSGGPKGEIDRAFESAGDGSRGVVYVAWDGGKGAHVFNVENVGGKVRYLDAQGNIADVSHYFSQGHGFQYVRLDDLPTPNPKGPIKQYVVPGQ